MKRHNRELHVIFGVIALLFLIFLAVPVLKLFGKSFLDNGITTGLYTSVLHSKGFGRTLGNSFRVSAAAAVLATTIAFVIAYAIHYPRIARPLKQALQAIATLPMYLPTITYGFAIIYSFGKQGLLTRVFGRQLFNIYGFREMYDYIKQQWV